MSRRIILSTEIQGVGTVREWDGGGSWSEPKPDGRWRLAVSVRDPSMGGKPHGPDEPTVTIYPLDDEREGLDDPPVFLVRELLAILGAVVAEK